MVDSENEKFESVARSVGEFVPVEYLASDVLADAQAAGSEQ